MICQYQRRGIKPTPKISAAQVAQINAIDIIGPKPPIARAKSEGSHITRPADINANSKDNARSSALSSG